MMADLAWDWQSIGSLMATLLFLRTAYRSVIPPEIQSFISHLFHRVMAGLNNDAKIIIDEYDGPGSINELYTAAQAYLGHHCLSDAPVVLLSKRHGNPPLAASLPSCHTTHDSFRGIPLQWTSNVDPSGGKSSYNFHRRYLELSFPRRHRLTVNTLYIPRVLEEAESIRLTVRQRRLFTNRSISGSDYSNLWSSVPFAHPSTFDTLAIDPALRDDVCADLLRFANRESYYARVGRPWKRGYLLYGPPGTGKTSLVAAIANFLEFDVYDLELSTVRSNSILRSLLVSTTPRSVIVVEDIDCSMDLSDRKKKKKKKKITTNSETDSDEGSDEGEIAASPTAPDVGEGLTVSLSGVLNFVDGLWSSAVGERLMIFTTNHPERLDPALLRPGRMDRKIHLSYCGPAAFRVLARNYLEIGEEHQLMATADALLGEVNMTPAEIAEVFLGCGEDGEGADEAMKKVVEEMVKRKEAAASSSLGEGKHDLE